MSTNALQESQGRSESPPDPSRDETRDSLQSSANGKPWKRLLFVAVGVVVVALAGSMLLKGMSAPHEADVGLTHRITRGNLTVSVIEQGTLESSENTEIKCKVRGQNTVTWVVEPGTYVNEGDELVRLDTLAIDEAIAERTKFAHSAQSMAERSKADVARAKLAILEYEQGRYQADLATLESALAVSRAGQRSAQNWFRHTKMLSERGFATDFEVEQQTLQVKQAELDVSVKETQIEVLKEFTRKEQLEILKGDLNAATATHQANVERAMADASRRDRALQELDYCVVKAEKSGMVIYPSAEQWKDTPDIEQGATVHLNQVLLLMPNLSRMQVKVGIHESVIDRVKAGLAANVSLPDKTLDAKVTSVALITRPAGWWTGNVVKYDTIIELPTVDGLKPGMTAEVEVVLAEHKDVLTIPVNAIVETSAGNLCWVKVAAGTRRRVLDLGDSNDQFIVVNAGLQEGDEVVLDPLAWVEEAQREAMIPHVETNATPIREDDSDSTTEPQDPGSGN